MTVVCAMKLNPTEGDVMEEEAMTEYVALSFRFGHPDGATLWIDVRFTDDMTRRQARDLAVDRLGELVKAPAEWQER